MNFFMYSLILVRAYDIINFISIFADELASFLINVFKLWL